MPIYVYKCSEDHRNEVLVMRPTDEPEKCEECGKPVERTMGVSAFHLKGGGWYADGYGSSKDD